MNKLAAKIVKWRWVNNTSETGSYREDQEVLEPWIHG
jgi:hypothetical protein